MHRTTYVCFSCMRTTRHESICSFCGKPSVYVSYKIEVPKKKKKLWKKFYDWLVKRNDYYNNSCLESRYGKRVFSQKDY